MALFEGLIYGGKFAFQNRLGQPYSWKEIYSFCFVLPCISSESNFLLVQALRELIFGGAILTDGFLRYEFWGLVHVGAHFRTFTVLSKSVSFQNRFLISLPKGLAQSFSVFSSLCVQFVYGGPCHGKSSAALGISTLKARFCLLHVVACFWELLRKVYITTTATITTTTTSTTTTSLFRITIFVQVLPIKITINS